VLAAVGAQPRWIDCGRKCRVGLTGPELENDDPAAYQRMARKQLKGAKKRDGADYQTILERFRDDQMYQNDMRERRFNTPEIVRLDRAALEPPLQVGRAWYDRRKKARTVQSVWDPTTMSWQHPLASEGTFNDVDMMAGEAGDLDDSDDDRGAQAHAGSWSRWSWREWGSWDARQDGWNSREWHRMDRWW